MPDSAIATAADYADALITARRAKNVLVLLLLLMLLTQLAIFFTAEYSNLIVPDRVEATAVTLPTTGEAPKAIGPSVWFEKLQYVVGLSGFTGVTLSIVLSFVILLLAQILLVGRLIGVPRITSAYIWTLVLVVLLFPWQAFLNNVAFDRPEFKIPGVFYTWDELRVNAKIDRIPTHPLSLAQTILFWARFVAFPIVSVLIVLAIQIKSNRGLRQALGEADYPTEDSLRH